jgi:energy-coupling factor transporter ATP-binding protein EcfA2
VEKFAKDINEMSDLVRARLYGLSVVDDAKKSLQQIESEWRTTAADVDGLVSAYDEITRIDQQISFVKKERQTLKKQTEVISSEEYKTLQKEIEQFAGAISSFDTYEKEYRRISLEISNLIKSIGRLDWSRYEGQAVLTSLSADLEKRKTELRIAFDEAKRKYDEADYSTQLNAKKTQLKGFLKDKGLSPENIGEVAAATQQIAEFDEQVKILRQERIPQQEVYDRKDSILEAYRKAYTSYKKEFEEVTNKLQSSLGDLTFDDPQTSISFELKTNDQLLKDMIVEFIKSNNPSRVSLRSDSIQNVLFGNSVIDLATMVSDKSKIAEVVSNSLVADVHTQIIQELVNESTFVEKLHLRMQRHHFDIRNIQVQTKLGEKLLQNTSFGERCGIVMAIVLVAGTNPIILDQPEDNLDGKYVSKVLVPLIRNQKLRRQIILVTRDANIAIGGDSELILILDKEERGTALLPATIENKIARPKYIWILDGGERAFQKREEKYAIKRTM